MEWISVKERLPVRSDYGFVKCLVCRSYFGKGSARFNTKTNEFVDDHFETIHDVTHWINFDLIPEPPEQINSKSRDA